LEVILNFFFHRFRCRTLSLSSGNGSATSTKHTIHDVSRHSPSTESAQNFPTWVMIPCMLIISSTLHGSFLWTWLCLMTLGFYRSA